MKSRILAPIVVLAVTCWPATASACTVCMGADDSQIGPAINAAIFLLLGCIGGVLALLVAFGITLMKRANAPLPPEAELQQS
jgi:hypothetical protein